MSDLTFSEVFYGLDRKAAKASTRSPQAREYISRLEEVAKAAYKVWKNTPHANKPNEITVSCLNDLYDKLVAVNFMDETME